MVHIVAFVRIKAGKVAEFAEIFKRHAPNVRKERGCIQYIATIDLSAGAPDQVLDENVVTSIEVWEDLDAIQSHVTGQALAAMEKEAQGLVEGVTLRVLREV